MLKQRQCPRRTHLQAVVPEQADQWDDRVEYSQEAQSRQHVAAALLQDKLIHVEERVQTVVLLAIPRLLLIYFFIGISSDLKGKEYIRDLCLFHSILISSPQIHSNQLLAEVDLSALPMDAKLPLSYLVEEKNEVDGEAHKQSQETQVVEVTSQEVLSGKSFD